METMRLIQCSNRQCNNWEELPADEPRSDAVTFELIGAATDEGEYVCSLCKYDAFVEFVEKEE